LFLQSTAFVTRTFLTTQAEPLDTEKSDHPRCGRGRPDPEGHWPRSPSVHRLTRIAAT